MPDHTIICATDVNDSVLIEERFANTFLRKRMCDFNRVVMLSLYLGSVQTPESQRLVVISFGR